MQASKQHPTRTQGPLSWHNWLSHCHRSPLCLARASMLHLAALCRAVSPGKGEQVQLYCWQACLVQDTAEFSPSPSARHADLDWLDLCRTESSFPLLLSLKQLGS